MRAVVPRGAELNRRLLHSRRHDRSACLRAVHQHPVPRDRRVRRREQRLWLRVGLQYRLLR